MPTKKNQKTTGALNLREVPSDLIASLKAAAAFARKPLKTYVLELLGKHVAELERTGVLPKGKG